METSGELVSGWVIHLVLPFPYMGDIEVLQPLRMGAFFVSLNAIMSPEFIFPKAQVTEF